MNTAAGRQLFIYWKVDAANADAAAECTRALQTRLQAQHPGLHTVLLRRAEEAGPQVTLMEVYSAPGGISPLLQKAIEWVVAKSTLTHCLDGSRHVEVFVTAGG